VLYAVTQLNYFIRASHGANLMALGCIGLSAQPSCMLRDKLHRILEEGASWRAARRSVPCFRTTLAAQVLLHDSTTTAVERRIITERPLRPLEERL